MGSAFRPSGLNQAFGLGTAGVCSLRLPPPAVSSGCQSNVPQTWGLAAKEIYFLTP